MNIYDLARAFMAVADAGSVQKAAAQLHQTEAAVSRKLSKLEDYLGAQLLWRHRRGAKLTDVGQRYYHQAKLAVQQFKQAERLVHNQVRAPGGILTVVANEFYAEQRIIPKLDAFLKQYPEIELKLDIAEVLPVFHKKQMDILFGVNLKGQEDLMQIPIDTMRYVLCAAPAYLQQYEEITTPAALLQHDFIVHSARERPELIVLDDGQSLQVKTKIWLNHSQSMIAAAKQGLGIIWMPLAFVETALHQGTLQQILKNDTRNTYDVYLYYRHEKYQDNKITAFVKFFKQ